MARQPFILASLADAHAPSSIRRSGISVAHGPVSERRTLVGTWLSENAEGIVCGIEADDPGPDLARMPRVRWLTPDLAKGLELNLLVLVNPESFMEGIGGAVDRYVAMTLATQQLFSLS